MMVGFLPAMIQNHGIFMYYGDFNSQQLMFYKHAQQMVKEGNLGLYHPELCQVARCIGVLGAERRAEGIDVPEGAGEGLAV